MNIIIDDEKIIVKIIRKKIKNIYFRFNEDFNLVVSCNNYVSENQIMDMIYDNINRLTKMYRETKQKNHQKNKYAILGDELELIIDPNQKKVIVDNFNIIGPSIEAIDKFYLKEAKKFLTVRFERVFRMMDDIPECKLRFRKMKTRWGVCNKTNKIVTLNTELYKFDVSLIDYVIIHELCHFKEPNHSPRFWQEVSKYYPHYKQARKLMKGSL